MKELAPLVLFVFNRPDHTRKVLEQADKCALADETIMYIFADGSRGDKDKESVAKTRAIIDEFQEKSGFKKVIIEKSEVNRGLKRSVIRGVTKVLEEYGRVIVLEDDLLVSEDFLIFMNDALDYYQDVEKIWSIAGYTPDLKSLRDYDKDVYMIRRGGSWGWATWYDRWKTIDWEASDYEKFRSDRRMVRDFRSIGYNLPEMLAAQKKGLIDSWAVLFTYEKFKQGRLTVNPSVSRIRNIGNDGSGTHSRSEDRFDVTLKEGLEPARFIQPALDKRVNREYYNFYAGGLFIRIAKRIWQNIRIRRHKAMVLNKQ